jgi:HEPN domain-containing protein
MKPREEVRLEFVRQWISKADEDLGLAKHILTVDAPFLGALVFHAQQAVEKYLKALLVSKEIDFPKTHNIATLLELVAGCDPTLAESLHETVALTQYGVEGRYPGDLPEVTDEEAQTAVALAERVRQEVLALLEPKV